MPDFRCHPRSSSAILHPPVVAEGETVRPLVADNATMRVIGRIVCVFGIGFHRWLLFTLAFYALPFFAGMMAGLAAYRSGAGIICALLVGFVAGAARRHRELLPPTLISS